MDSQISVEPEGENQFRVTVSEGSTKTSHLVTVQPKDYARLTGNKIPPGDLVNMAFEFLLEHEPKESILRSFDLMVIARYFPSFEREVFRRLPLR